LFAGDLGWRVGNASLLNAMLTKSARVGTASWFGARKRVGWSIETAIGTAIQRC